MLTGVLESFVCDGASIPVLVSLIIIYMVQLSALPVIVEVFEVITDDCVGCFRPFLFVLVYGYIRGDCYVVQVYKNHTSAHNTGG
jgi:hypothetical protein